MKFRVFYVSENGKNYVKVIEAYSEDDAKTRLRKMYNDIAEIVKVQRV